MQKIKPSHNSGNIHPVNLKITVWFGMAIKNFKGFTFNHAIKNIKEAISELSANEASNVINSLDYNDGDNTLLTTLLEFQDEIGEKDFKDIVLYLLSKGAKLDQIVYVTDEDKKNSAELTVFYLMSESILSESLLNEIFEEYFMKIAFKDTCAYLTSLYKNEKYKEFNRLLPIILKKNNKDYANLVIAFCKNAFITDKKLLIDLFEIACSDPKPNELLLIALFGSIQEKGRNDAFDFLFNEKSNTSTLFLEKMFDSIYCPTLVDCLLQSEEFKHIVKIKCKDKSLSKTCQLKIFKEACKSNKFDLSVIEALLVDAQLDPNEYKTNAGYPIILPLILNAKSEKDWERIFCLLKHKANLFYQPKDSEQSEELMPSVFCQIIKTIMEKRKDPIEQLKNIFEQLKPYLTTAKVIAFEDVDYTIDNNRTIGLMLIFLKQFKLLIPMQFMIWLEMANKGHITFANAIKEINSELSLLSNASEIINEQYYSEDGDTLLTLLMKFEEKINENDFRDIILYLLSLGAALDTIVSTPEKYKKFNEGEKLTTFYQILMSNLKKELVKEIFEKYFEKIDIENVFSFASIFEHKNPYPTAFMRCLSHPKITAENIVLFCRICDKKNHHLDFNYQDENGKTMLHHLLYNKGINSDEKKKCVFFLISLDYLVLFQKDNNNQVPLQLIYEDNDFILYKDFLIDKCNRILENCYENFENLLKAECITNKELLFELLVIAYSSGKIETKKIESLLVELFKSVQEGGKNALFDFLFDEKSNTSHLFLEALFDSRYNLTLVDYLLASKEFKNILKIRCKEQSLGKTWQLKIFKEACKSEIFDLSVIEALLIDAQLDPNAYKNDAGYPIILPLILNAKSKNDWTRVFYLLHHKANLFYQPKDSEQSEELMPSVFCQIIKTIMEKRKDPIEHLKNIFEQLKPYLTTVKVIANERVVYTIKNYKSSSPILTFLERFKLLIPMQFMIWLEMANEGQITFTMAIEEIKERLSSHLNAREIINNLHYSEDGDTLLTLLMKFEEKIEEQNFKNIILYLLSKGAKLDILVTPPNEYKEISEKVTIFHLMSITSFSANLKNEIFEKYFKEINDEDIYLHIISLFKKGKQEAFNHLLPIIFREDKFKYTGLVIGLCEKKYITDVKLLVDLLEIACSDLNPNEYLLMLLFGSAQDKNKNVVLDSLLEQKTDISYQPKSSEQSQELTQCIFCQIISIVMQNKAPKSKIEHIFKQINRSYPKMKTLLSQVISYQKSGEIIKTSISDLLKELELLDVVTSPQYISKESQQNKSEIKQLHNTEYPSISVKTTLPEKINKKIKSNTDIKKLPTNQSEPKSKTTFFKSKKSIPTTQKKEDSIGSQFLVNNGSQTTATQTFTANNFFKAYTTQIDMLLQLIRNELNKEKPALQAIINLYNQLNYVNPTHRSEYSVLFYACQNPNISEDIIHFLLHNGESVFWKATESVREDNAWCLAKTSGQKNEFILWALACAMIDCLESNNYILSWRINMIEKLFKNNFDKDYQSSNGNTLSHCVAFYILTTVTGNHNYEYRNIMVNLIQKNNISLLANKKGLTLLSLLQEIKTLYKEELKSTLDELGKEISTDCFLKSYSTENMFNIFGDEDSEELDLKFSYTYNYFCKIANTFYESLQQCFDKDLQTYQAFIEFVNIDNPLYLKDLIPQETMKDKWIHFCSNNCVKIEDFFVSFTISYSNAIFNIDEDYKHRSQSIIIPPVKPSTQILKLENRYNLLMREYKIFQNTINLHTEKSELAENERSVVNCGF